MAGGKAKSPGKGARGAPARRKTRQFSTTPGPDSFGCSIKQLPAEELALAAETAIQLNPANAPVQANAPAYLLSVVTEPSHLALLTSKYWGKDGVRLTVGWLDGPSQALRKKILARMNAWNEWANVEFVETSTDPQVRIDRGPGGYWSYLGTDILRVPAGKPTMNLQAFTENTPDSEFHRVVEHEVGHTLGFPHEHMRRDIIELLDPEKTVAYFMRTQGWTRQDVIQQVLTPLEESAIMGTPTAEWDSVMTYQLPAVITKSGKGIPGGTGITPSDGAFAGKVYPKAATTPPPVVADAKMITIKVWGADKIEIPGYKVTKLAS